MSAVVALDPTAVYRAAHSAVGAHAAEADARRARLARERVTLGAMQADLAELRLEGRLDGRAPKDLPKAAARVAELTQTIDALVSETASDPVVSERLAAREREALVGYRTAEGERLRREAAPLIAKAIEAATVLLGTLAALDTLGSAANDASADAGLGALAWRDRVRRLLTQWLDACGA